MKNIKDKRVSQSQIDRIKEIQLEMLNEVDNFCRQNDIKYCLAYGSLLGAIRHNGYIPWDDDLDIWMPRTDYEKFIKLYNSKHNVVCSMSNTENYPFYMSKIINQNTTLIENGVKHLNFNYGVYIDVFVLDTLPKNKIIEELKLFKNYFLYCQLKIKFSDSNNPIFNMLKKHIDPIKIENKQKALWVNTKGIKYKDDTTLYFLNKNKENKKYKFDINLFEELEDHKFENLTCKIPKKYDAILTQCYGDYMEIPPVEKRIVHNFIFFKENNND